MLHLFSRQSWRIAVLIGTAALSACTFYPNNKSVGVPFCAAGEGEIYKLTVYRVDQGANDPAAARLQLREALARYPGFRCALPLAGIDDPALGADLVVWRSSADAARAADAAATDPKLAALAAAIQGAEVAATFTELGKAPAAAAAAPAPAQK